ncbi:vacuolar iron transporter [Thecamonas trahens ATCC 50062]|uniref:Vacuolar iron transporter n=1 Tax=Thecamonas trahens ATCC 50062 TaxID=461836 RepID=A0A0L0DW47_THETB|nr:vacuolar iron transporter [Thecamonas trahens ATCC 50062]KNC56397.1 vacuolar iron transporter [Thecamonas trahens ATCC 50062]|eukprot:XP_013760911.1 vacuolar iron transporter [Thecamonas trahens ATCC 50062]
MHSVSSYYSSYYYSDDEGAKSPSPRAGRRSRDAAKPSREEGRVNKASKTSKTTTGGSKTAMAGTGGADGNAGISTAEKYRKARAAHASGDVEAMRAAHAAHVENHAEAGSYVKALVFGGLDGIVTTFAVVAGVAGANLSTGIVLVLGLANLIADGLSMGVGEFVSGKAELEFMRSERKREEWEVDHAIEHEKQEMVELYTAKGMTEDDAVTVVDIISKDPKLFVDIMMVEELGLNPDDENESPAKQGLVMFFSFLIFGAVPLVAYIVSRLAGVGGKGGVDANFAVSCAMTAVTLFILGAFKQHISMHGKIGSIIKGGLIMVLNGGVSASAAFFVGLFLRFLIEEDSDAA